MYLFLINPEAGNRKFSRIERQLRRLLDRHRIKYRFVMIGNLTEVPDLLTKHLRPTDSGVVAVGGNATVNAVLNSLAGEEVPLGIIPLSRTNHLAHSLGLKRLSVAIKALADRELKLERLGRIGQHYFVGEVEIAPRSGLLTQYLRKASPWMKFLGLTRQAALTDDGTLTTIQLDEEVKVVGNTRRVQIKLNGEQGDKKLKLTFFTSPDPSTASVLHSDALSVVGETKMPVLVGNEMVAHTPVEIRGLTKYVRLIVPKPSQLTTAKSS